ncbi:MAG TPA: beta-galactosidase trimerization domain-containing protein [Planctomycetota bacterium]|nr:beta-galactosidase trimerization domain-containing protein [Planctomycetota bacterium]
MRLALAVACTLTCHLATAADRPVVLQTAVEPIATVPAPPAWDRFTILVWQINTDVVSDRALYESVNLRGFHVDRRNDKLQEFARETGWPFYVDHAADKGYLHVRPNVIAPLMRKKDIIVRPNSLADPATIATMKDHLRANVASAKGSSVVAYAFDDEVSTGSFCSPIEADGHPLSVAGYRRELERTYGTIAALNAQYGTDHHDFAAIEPQSFEAFRRQLTKDGIATLNLSAWCDWRAAMDTQFADCLIDLTNFTNGLDPAVPAGFVGGQSPNAFGGYDYRKLTKAVQWMEAYDIGASNEVLRSFWDQRSSRMQTFFSSENPKLDSWYLWYYLCHGNRGVIAWPNVDAKNQPWFANGAVADFIAANAETFKEVQGPVSQKILGGEFVHDPVALYYSHPSIQLSWALDAAPHGGTWPNRLSSMDNHLSTSGLSRIGWLKTLEDLGVQGKFIHQDHLLEGALIRDGYKVLVLNRTLCLSDAEATAIKAFAAKGGTVIADHLCGICDEHGKARAVGALDDLFGVSRDLGRGWLDGDDMTEVDGERDDRLSEKSWAVGAARSSGMAVFEKGLKAADGATASAADGTAVVVHKARAVYLNLSPIGYLLQRSSDTAAPWLDLVGGLLKAATVEPRIHVAVGGKAAKRIETLFWKHGDRTTLCVVGNIDRAATIDSFGTTGGALGDAEVELTLRFARPVKKLVNERTGAALGDGAEFKDRFTPWQANVYTFSE